MSAGYSKTPLIKKIGIKPGHQVALVHAPDHYLDLLGELPADVVISMALGPDVEKYDVVHAFYVQRSNYESEFSSLKSAIRKNGMVWISWYKKAAKIPTDITEDVVRDVALAGGLVDVKVAAVDQEWSGLKLMYRKEDR
ncbi:MAG: DUF3052 domain-containing protein [Chloroflexota bacterium]